MGTMLTRFWIVVLCQVTASAHPAAGRSRGRHLAAPQTGDGPERGDVPGWVMITLMSAVLVAALLAIAGPALEGLFRSAIDQVSPGK